MKIFFSLLFIYLTHCAPAQFLEFGLGTGVFNYSGDMARGYHFETMNSGFNIFNRLNFSSHVSLKTTLGFGGLQGSDNTPIDALAQKRAAEFHYDIMDLSSVLEYDFLNYKEKRAVVRWTPYAFLGIGILKVFKSASSATDYSTVQPTIPFGIGFKHLIRRRWMAGFEVGARRTFSDNLDGVSEGVLTQKDFLYGNPLDKDWYSFAGLSLSFMIYNIPCPFPYTPNN
ncbi:MAG: hypothetical protein HQ474_02045 [Flammeovirgaceae bacterium]|nr:hypothetical protein [Flammeovirgaceae bacterium]